MYIENIEISNFRNYDKLEVEFNKNVNLILGKNAQGKTNLLEAIYLTAIGRSFRTSKDIELVKFDREVSKIKVKAKKELNDTSVEISLKRKGNNSVEKYIKKDKKNISKTSQLIKNILIVIFSPEDLKIVKDEPEKRRKFIDRELSQISPKYYNCLSNYKKALLQRNTYLKEDNIELSILEIWDKQLAKYGAEVIYLRREFISKISKYSSKIHSGISGNTEVLRLNYESNIEIKENITEQEEYIYELLKKSFKIDSKNRNTSIGPHRDDVSFIVNDIDMRNYGSQGQQRTCALSLKLAELNLIKEETEEDAILLLDDVMSELDANRQEFLIDTMRKNQLFITTTEIDSNIKEKFEDLSVFYVEKGKIL
ncbi:MAG: DNA replication/repair protein RecF [Eubacterium sp.]|nr:DNA replication/repair protein RecF [Eubacterium sp.]